MKEQAHILYSGTVQGVGFRFTVQRFAHQGGLLGWVRNLADGRVEVLVEGEKSSIEALAQEIESNFEGYISERKVEYVTAQGQFKDFRITH